jgi:hypothetical protein
MWKVSLKLRIYYRTSYFPFCVFIIQLFQQFITLFPRKCSTLKKKRLCGHIMGGALNFAVMLIVYFTQEIYILFLKDNSSSTHRAAEATALVRSAHSVPDRATGTFPRARRGRARK